MRLRRRLATMLFMASNGFSLELATPPLLAVTVLSCLAPPPRLVWQALSTFWQMSMRDWRKEERREEGEGKGRGREEGRKKREENEGQRRGGSE